MRHHGYSQPLTAKQCSDLEEENNELVKQIAEMESQKIVGLEDVLRIEREKYESLKQ